jgi:gliding motility-associated-like protein
VIVEETAFVPNLFTPNNDGSNDALKIYGLGAAREFSFTIFNREGNQVFHTNSVSDAVNIGWNGTLRGADLPAGVYYWRVSGRGDSGKGLQLNGKSSGSIVLLR